MQPPRGFPLLIILANCLSPRSDWIILILSMDTIRCIRYSSNHILVRNLPDGFSIHVVECILYVYHERPPACSVATTQSC